MDATITITIGEISRPLSEATNDWINSQISGRQKEGPVCVRVRIKGPDVDIVLATGACQSGPGGGRQTTPKEDLLFDRWKEKRLNELHFSHGGIVSFINALR